MNKTLLSTSLVAIMAAISFAPTAKATDGTITFNGKVLSSTCTVSNAGSGGALAVRLPDVAYSVFTAKDVTAGLTPFSLNLTGCPTTPSGVEVGAVFSGTGIDSTTGAIRNTGTATGVQVQMTDSSGTALDLRTNSNPVKATLSGSTASLSYEAQYLSTAATVVAGTVTASVIYTLTYN